MECPYRPGVEMVRMDVRQQHQPQVFLDRLQGLERHAAVDQNTVVDDHGVALGAG